MNTFLTTQLWPYAIKKYEYQCALNFLTLYIEQGAPHAASGLAHFYDSDLETSPFRNISSNHPELHQLHFSQRPPKGFEPGRDSIALSLRLAPRSVVIRTVQQWADSIWLRTTAGCFWTAEPPQSTNGLLDCPTSTLWRAATLS